MCIDVVAASLLTMYSPSIICKDKGILNGKIIEKPDKNPDCYPSMGTYAPLTTLHKNDDLRCKYHYQTVKSS
jgi:hypothetical protein